MSDHLAVDADYAHTPLDPDEVSTVKNAVGFEIFGFDRATHIVDGVPRIDITDDEDARLTRAAENAIRHLEEHRRRKASV